MSDLLCKVCGLTRSEDVLLCHSLGVDFTGFIFVRKSPRFILPDIVAALSKGPSLRVGVFAGATRDEVSGIARSAHLDMVQLHGGEDVDFCRDIGLDRVIKVLWPEQFSPGALEAEMERFAPVCSYFLLDAGQSGGGSGKSIGWSSLRGLHPPKPWLLAGGLGLENLPEALSACAPDGVDLNSALESAPGIKDHDALRRALALVKNYSGSETGHTMEKLS